MKFILPTSLETRNNKDNIMPPVEKRDGTEHVEYSEEQERDENVEPKDSMDKNNEKSSKLDPHQLRPGQRIQGSLHLTRYRVNHRKINRKKDPLHATIADRTQCSTDNAVENDSISTMFEIRRHRDLL